MGQNKHRSLGILRAKKSKPPYNHYQTDYLAISMTPIDVSTKRVLTITEMICKDKKDITCKHRILFVYERWR